LPRSINPWEVGSLRKLALLFLLIAALAFPKYFVVMVTDTAGLGDKSFNDSVWAGIQKAVQFQHLVICL
jgi:basic membrane lipoprotein Med (substrate-binding protein (PBP1-ABC) superfamily)